MTKPWHGKACRITGHTHVTRNDLVMNKQAYMRVTNDHRWIPVQRASNSGALCCCFLCVFWFVVCCCCMFDFEGFFVILIWSKFSNYFDFFENFERFRFGSNFRNNSILGKILKIFDFIKLLHKKKRNGVNTMLMKGGTLSSTRICLHVGSANKCGQHSTALHWSHISAIAFHFVQPFAQAADNNIFLNWWDACLYCYCVFFVFF